MILVTLLVPKCVYQSLYVALTHACSVHVCVSNLLEVLAQPQEDSASAYKHVKTTIRNYQIDGSNGVSVKGLGTAISTLTTQTPIKSKSGYKKSLKAEQR